MLLPLSGRSVAALFTLLCLGLVLAGCGRKGALEPPPSTMIENEQGERLIRPQEDKPFILDRLIQPKK